MSLLEKHFEYDTDIFQDEENKEDILKQQYQNQVNTHEISALLNDSEKFLKEIVIPPVSSSSMSTTTDNMFNI